MQLRTINKTCLSARVYKLYLLCLPFEQLFDFGFGDFFSKVIPQFSTIVMLIGTFLLLLGGASLKNSRNQLFMQLYLYMVVASVVMASVLSFQVAAHQESPFSVILGDVILYFFVVLSVFYNSYCLSHYGAFINLSRIFDWQVIILLVVGYAQLAGMLGFSAPYDLLSSVFALRELSWLENLNRGVTFFGTEPSSAAILCFVVIPYLFSSIQVQRGFKRYYYIVALLLFVFLIFSSNSSQLLILFLGALALFIWNCLMPIKRIFYYASFTLGALFAIAYLGAESISMTSNSDNTSIEYVVLGKVVDRENLSTAMRASTVINDLKVFADYPITGVGDGNQGYFYADNQPAWTTYSQEVSDLILTHAIPNGGGNFFPAYISAYGLIGIVVLLAFFARYKELYRTSFLMEDKRMNRIFQIAIILFLFSGWHVVGIKQSETIIFVLSLPCIVSMANRIQEEI